jgi:hypothetical protein
MDSGAQTVAKGAEQDKSMYKSAFLDIFHANFVRATATKSSFCDSHIFFSLFLLFAFWFFCVASLSWAHQRFLSSLAMEVDSWKHLFLAAGFGEEAAKQYSDLFVKHEIDLSMLADLAHPVLESMGVWKAGHRIRILRMQRLIYSAQQGQGARPSGPLSFSVPESLVFRPRRFGFVPEPRDASFYRPRPALFMVYPRRVFQDFSLFGFSSISTESILQRCLFVPGDTAAGPPAALLRFPHLIGVKNDSNILVSSHSICPSFFGDQGSLN